MAASNVKSIASRRFWELFHALPPEIRELAVKNYRLRRLKGSPDRFTVRVGNHYCALGSVTADTITWVRIGTHTDYESPRGLTAKVL